MVSAGIPYNICSEVHSKTDFRCNGREGCMQKKRKDKNLSPLGFISTHLYMLRSELVILGLHYNHFRIIETSKEGFA